MADDHLPRMTEHEFAEAVDDALDSLPDEIARTVAESNVVIQVEEEPPPGQNLLGLYVGIPLDRRSVFDGYAQPDRIVLYSGPLQRVSATRAELVRQIRVTVLHEIGHLFGLSDARLHELGWG